VVEARDVRRGGTTICLGILVAKAVNRAT